MPLKDESDKGSFTIAKVKRCDECERECVVVEVCSVCDAYLCQSCIDNGKHPCYT